MQLSFQCGVIRHFEFANFWIFVTFPLPGVKIVSAWNSDNLRLRYGDIMILKMAVVRHVGFGNWTFSSPILRMCAIMPPNSKFRLNRTIWSRVIAENDFQYGVSPPSWIWEFLNFCHVSVALVKICVACQISSNSDDSRWDMKIIITIFKMAAVRHVGFIVTSSYCTGRLSLTLLTLCKILTYIGFTLSDILQLSCFTILAWNCLFLP